MLSGLAKKKRVVEDGNRLTSRMMKLTAISSRGRENRRLERFLGEILLGFLSSSSMSPPER